MIIPIPEKNTSYMVRRAVSADLDRILEIYAGARAFMANNGNPNQWGTTNPPVNRLILDIEEGNLYVIVDEKGIHGVFYLYIGEDPTYSAIYSGSWHSDKTYGTIHRIAGDGSGGILHTAVIFSSEQIDYLRIDTHQDNVIMQNAVVKEGFLPCGIIYVEDGTPRIAYDKIVK